MERILTQIVNFVRHDVISTRVHRSWLRVHELTAWMERVFTGRELVNTTSRLEWNAALVHRVKSHLTFLLLLAEVSLCRQLEDLIRKYHIMAVVPNIGVEKKWHAVLRNHKADVPVYEAWQLWWQRDVVKLICFSFCICSLVFKLRVQSRTTAQLWGKICRFLPCKMFLTRTSLSKYDSAYTDIFLNQLIQFYSNNAINLHYVTTHSTTVFGYWPTKWRSYCDHRYVTSFHPIYT